MPAPPDDLVKALRAGTVQRHLFFRLDHSQGEVFAWDGIGDFVLGGNVYKGVRGFAQLEGVSDSGDVQNHEVIARLNGVSLASFMGVDPDIRGRAAQIIAAWIDEYGNILWQRSVFRAKGDVLTTRFTDDENSVAPKLRAPLAEWQTPPRAYYTDKDQQRRFADDSGFSQVRKLENVTIAGWSVNEEATGGFGRVNTRYRTPYDDLDGRPLGNATRGLTVVRTDSGTNIYHYNGTTAYLEDVTGAAITSPNTGLVCDILCGGTVCYIDINGDLRTPGGNLVYLPSANPHVDERITRAATIAADGSSTSDYVGTTTSAPSTLYGGLWPLASKNGLALGPNPLARVFDNAFGCIVQHDVGTNNLVSWNASGAANYVEDVTGDAITVSGGRAKCHGNDLIISTTGVVLTSAGKRVVLPGVTNSFLRIWT